MDFDDNKIRRELGEVGPDEEPPFDASDPYREMGREELIELLAKRDRAASLEAKRQRQNRDAALSDRQRAIKWEWLSTWGGDAIGEAPPQPRWLLVRDDGERVKGVMRAGKVGLLVAAGGGGKTFAAAGLALVCAIGRERRWLGTFRAPDPGHVVLALAEEDADEMRRRLHYTAIALDLSEAERRLAASRILPLPLEATPVALIENTAAGNTAETAFLAEMRERIDGLGVDVKAIILDPLSRFAGLETEASNAMATRFVQSVETLTKVRGGPAVIVAHHSNKGARASGKDDAQSARGASALVDGARWVATLTTHVGTNDAVTFGIRKSNYSAPGKPVLLWRGRGGALRLATPAERAELESKRPEVST